MVDGCGALVCSIWPKRGRRAGGGRTERVAEQRGDAGLGTAADTGADWVVLGVDGMAFGRWARGMGRAG